jgi:hypothetical protein
MGLPIFLQTHENDVLRTLMGQLVRELLEAFAKLYVLLLVLICRRLQPIQGREIWQNVRNLDTTERGKISLCKKSGRSREMPKDCPSSSSESTLVVTARLWSSGQPGVLRRPNI